MSLDLLAQSDLSSPANTPSLLGKKTPSEKCERFSQDMPPGYLYRLKLAPVKRNKLFTVKELRRNGHELENTHMESTFHPCLYIPHEDLEFRPYMCNLVLGTQAKQRLRVTSRSESPVVNNGSQKDGQNAGTMPNSDNYSDYSNPNICSNNYKHNSNYKENSNYNNDNYYKTNGNSSSFKSKSIKSHNNSNFLHNSKGNRSNLNNNNCNKSNNAQTSCKDKCSDGEEKLNTADEFKGDESKENSNETEEKCESNSNNINGENPINNNNNSDFVGSFYFDLADGERTEGIKITRGGSFHSSEGNLETKLPRVIDIGEKRQKGEKTWKKRPLTPVRKTVSSGGCRSRQMRNLSTLSS